MTKKWLKVLSAAGAVMMLAGSLSGCKEYTRDKKDEWKTKFDISNPALEGAGMGQSAANEAGWYVTLEENFDGDTIPELFAPSPHGLRKKEYWCDQMISFENGNAVIKAVYDDNHQCDVCKEKEGYFTSGLDTCATVDGERVPLFEQAFGYFEARVKVPQAGGMWSAFWLQVDNMTNIGFGGEDGSEIDILESSFYNSKRTKVGHAIHYDGYPAKTHRCLDTIRDTGTDLYEGYHTYALKWTPTEYVFYVDGNVTWASDFGGVCKVPAYLRLTSEIQPKKVGPYGQRLGKFNSGDFYIDYVKVYQNVNYLDEIKSPADYVKE